MVVSLFLFIAGLAIAFSGSSDGLVIGLLLSAVSAVFFGIEVAKDIPLMKLNSRKDMVIISVSNSHIALNSRTSNNSKVLFIEADRDVSVKKTPAELVYTGATVGGVSVGGFHVNPESESVSLGDKTGTYSIYLRQTNGITRVKKINLKPDMLSSARSHPVVSEFLRGDHLFLEHNVPYTTPPEILKAAEEFKRQGRYDMVAKTLRPYQKSRLLTKEECCAVIAWMSDESGR